MNIWTPFLIGASLGLIAVSFALHKFWDFMADESIIHAENAAFSEDEHQKNSHLVEQKAVLALIPVRFQARYQIRALHREILRKHKERK